MKQTIKAPYRIGFTTDELKFMIHALEIYKISQESSLEDLEVDPDDSLSVMYMTLIHLADEMLAKIRRHIKESEAMKARREYYEN